MGTKICVKDLWRWIEENGINAINDNQQYNECNELLKAKNLELTQKTQHTLFELEQYKQDQDVLESQNKKLLIANKELNNNYLSIKNQITNINQEYERNQQNVHE